MKTEKLTLAVSAGILSDILFTWEGQLSAFHFEYVHTKKLARETLKCLAEVQKLPLESRRAHAEKLFPEEVVNRAIWVSRALKNVKEGVEKRGNTFEVEFIF